MQSCTSKPSVIHQKLFNEKENQGQLIDESLIDGGKRARKRHGNENLTKASLQGPSHRLTLEQKENHLASYGALRSVFISSFPSSFSFQSKPHPHNGASPFFNLVSKEQGLFKLLAMCDFV